MAHQKEFGKVVTVTIEDDGSLVFLATPEADIFLEQGETITRRASHVEPVNVFLRLAFHLLRMFGNKTQIAEWTRHWPCLWRVNTSPVGGPVLRLKDVYHGWCTCPAVAVFSDRQKAIDAEIKFLNRWFAERPHHGK